MLPRHLGTLSLQLRRGEAGALRELVAGVKDAGALHLRGIPVGADLVAGLLRRWPLEYLDVVDTEVTQEDLSRLVAAHPGLRTHPRLTASEG